MPLPALGLSYRAGATAEVPLYLALTLHEMGAVELDEAAGLDLREVNSLKFREAREQYPVKLPPDFYARLRVSLRLLERRGDVKGQRALVQEARDLLLARLKKLAALALSGIPTEVEERLTPEERALVHSAYSLMAGFMSEML